MELGENNLICESGGRVIATFDFSNEGQDITEIEQRQISFTDGFEENIAENDIEEIEMLKDVEITHERSLAVNESDGNKINKNLKDYIKLCREMELIQSWTDFERYCKLKNNC